MPATNLALTSAMIPAFLKRFIRYIAKHTVERIPKDVGEFGFIMGFSTIFTVGMMTIPNPMVIGMFWYPFLPSIPQSKDIAEVPRFYGPGAYIAWVFCTVSAIVGSATRRPSKLRLSPDQMASYIYSATSMYWNYARILWYSLKGLDLIEDPSVQAAFFVFNVSALFHVLGLLLSTEERKGAWLSMVVWDSWRWFLSPMLFVSEASVWIHTIILPTVLIIMIVATGKIRPRPWNLALFLLLPFALLEAARSQFFTTPPLLLPRSSSNIMDKDQLAFLTTGITIIVYQWELWNLPRVSRRFRTKFGQKHIRSKSVQLEESTMSLESTKK